MTFLQKLARLTADRHKVRISRRAGLAPTTVSNYLNRGSMPGADIAFRLARALNVSVEWMLDDSQGWPPVWVNAPEPTAPRHSRRSTRRAKQAA